MTGLLYSSGVCRPVTCQNALIQVQSLASGLQLICEFMINMAASLEPEDESSEGWALDDSDGDAAYVERPRVRSQLPHTSMKKPLTKGRSEEGAVLENEERKPMTGTLRLRYPEARLFRTPISNPCLIFSHRNTPQWIVKMRPLTTLPDLCWRSMQNVETS